MKIIRKAHFKRFKKKKTLSSTGNGIKNAQLKSYLQLYWSGTMVTLFVWPAASQAHLSPLDWVFCNLVRD